MASTAHVVIEDHAGTIFPASAVGRLITPMLPGKKAQRVALIVSEADGKKMDRLLASQTADIRVTDKLTGETFKIERADCGLGCRCAARIVS